MGETLCRKKHIDRRTVARSIIKKTLTVRQFSRGFALRFHNKNPSRVAILLLDFP